MSFFERVLPSVGPYTLFTGTTGPDGKLDQQRHWNGLQTHEAVAREVARLSTQPLNVFFAVGSYAGTNRADPVAKRCFYLDLDSKDFGSIESAVSELGAFVRATGLPPPNIYVHSGRGVHVYWCLDRDLPMDEWKPIAKALKAKCEELDFKADPTATVDGARVLRAPGSLNRKGETPLPCRVLTDNNGSYDPQTIAKQLQVAALVGAKARLAAAVTNDDLVTKTSTERTWSPDQVKDMLNYVRLPDFAGRDMWWQTACAIQDGLGKTNESFDIFDTWSATQPNYDGRDDCWATWDSFKPGSGFKIGTLIKFARDGGWVMPMDAAPAAAVPITGASFAETMAQPATSIEVNAEQPEAPAAAQVQGDFGAAPLLIGASHAVAAGGKARFDYNTAVMWLASEFVMIMDQEGLYFSMTERVPMGKTSIDDMLTRFMPYNSNGVPINATVLMRRHGVMQTVNSQGFFPGKPRIYAENGKRYVNLYTDPPAEIVPTKNEVALFTDFWDYLFPRAEDKPFGQYLLQFYAHIVQRPAVKITSAPLMVSKEFGTGKTTAMYDIPRALVGNDNAKMVSNKVLRSQFTDYITGSHFLHFDEVHINGRWDSDDTANSMKNLVTGSSVEIHPKGLKPYNIPNRLFITATSNYEDAISLPTSDERRWGVYYLEPIRGYSKEQKAIYFKMLHDWIRSDRGAGVLRYIFARIPLIGFNPSAAPPMTQAKLNMVEKSQLTEVQVLRDASENGDGPFKKDLFTCSQICIFLQSQTGRQYPIVAVKGFLQRAFPTCKPARQIRVGNERVRIYAHRNHEKWEAALPEELRDAFNNP